MPVTIFHNPKCATSRATLKLIRDHGIEPRVVEYLTATPSKAELAELIRRLGLTPRQLLRTREPEYKRAGLDDPRRSDAAILAAMVKHPRLIERPIVTRGRKAVLGRPPERVLELLE